MGPGNASKGSLGIQTVFPAAPGKMRVDAGRKRCYNNPCLKSDACVAQLVEQLTRNEQVAGSSPATSSKKPGPWTWFFSFCPRAYKARQTFLKVRRALAVIAPVILKPARALQSGSPLGL